MTWYGGMNYGTECGKWVLKVRCGEWLCFNMPIIGVASFWKISLLLYFQLIRGLLKVNCTLLPTLFLIYINGLLGEVEKCLELCTKFSKTKNFWSFVWQ